MKMKNVALLAGVAVPLILAGPASGAFVGLKTVKKFVDPADIIADALNIPGVTSLMVVNVYAEFTPGDVHASVLAWGGSVGLGIPLQINTRDGIFFQHVFGDASNKSPGSAFFPLARTLQYDSFGTIGRKSSAADNIDGTGVIGFEAGAWTDTRFTGGVEFSFFIEGFPAQASAGGGDSPPDQVLIAQFTLVNPNAGANPGIFGTMFINFRHTIPDPKNPGEFIAGLDTVAASFDNQIPAPGALALLGTAGLLGCRRRRRRS